ncbi:MAG TPA: hypothetical protein VLI90_01085, partial [Tepidisphaeraceae bacterium]|nr:hypothetical protein [Tepidisphaeraceae bacterium]
MSITAVCPSCGKRFQAPAQFAGKRVKCKQCGVVFQIAAQGGGAAAPAAGTAGTQRNQTNSQSKAGDQIDIDDSLAQLESVASFAGEDAPPPQASRAGSKVGSKAGAAGGTSAGAGAGGKPRIVGRDELNTKMEANPDAEEVELEGPTDVSYRANVLKFRYPGAKIIDQWLPLFLLVLGFGLMAMVISPRDQTYGIRWIAAARFVIPVLLYRILILPMAMAMVHKAGQEMRYQMPPNEKLRGFATYLPALAFAFTFWTASGGSVLGLILGAFIGLALSSAALWLLFRLRDEEVSTSIGYGAGGFGIGMGIAIALILGLNLLMTVVLTQTKSQAKVPASPFGPNLSWVSTSSSSTAVANAKPAKAAPKPAAPTDTQASAPTKSNIDSAVLSDVQTSPV